MRLDAIKLAGFKTFAEPTLVRVDAAKVAIVGPNGCGKSNLVDAIRWVLGESRAGSLRGEAIADVIFAGSAHRPAAARASVELRFSLEAWDEKRLGAWGRFPELSVRRVLTRDGPSQYFLNDQAVRRRDVLDVFLGTGLGPRAYAIIEQGMVQRLIEAKPEALRELLEEAAGVSRYRERRKETEAKLTQAQAHLTRVRDQLGALEGQLTSLRREAEIARRWQQLELQRRQAEQRWCFSALQQAQGEWQRLATQLAAKESEMAAWRDAFADVQQRIEAEQARFESSRAQLEAAQRAWYEVQSEVLRLEQAIAAAERAHRDWQREEETLSAGLQRWQEQQRELKAQLAQAQSELAVLEEQIVSTSSQLEEACQAAAAIEVQWRALQPVRQQLHQERQHWEREVAQRRAQTEALHRQIASIEARLAKADTQVAASNERITPAAIARQEEQLQQQAQALAALQAQLNEAQEALRKAEERVHLTRERCQELRREEAVVEAQLRQLQQWQAQRTDATVKPVGDQGLRLWQVLRLREPRYAPAIEAALAPWLQAPLGAPGDPPPWVRGGLSLQIGQSPADWFGQTVIPSADTPHGLRAAATLVEVTDARWAAWVEAALARVYCAEAIDADVDAWAVRQGVWVYALDGRCAGPLGQLLPSDEADAHAGMLQRQAELERLQREWPRLRDERAQAEKTQSQAEAARRDAQQAVMRLQQALQQSRQEHERLRVELARQHERLKALAEAERVRLANLAAWQEELNALTQTATVSKAQWQEANERMSQWHAQWQAHQQTWRECEAKREAAREHCQKLDKALWELHARKARSEALQTAAQTALQNAQEEYDRQQAALFAHRERRQRLPDIAALRVQLDERQAQRRVAEDALAQARQAHEHHHQGLRTEQARQQELLLARDVLERQLTELQQQLALAQAEVERWQERLEEAGVDPAGLTGDSAAMAGAAAPAEPNRLRSEIARLEREIAALGPINHAAIETLAALQAQQGERRAQLEDIEQAVRTLEGAMRRIDEESREALRQTFQSVNAAFGKRFQQIFQGGEAKLAWTSEAILQAGVAILAHPPGKRNQSIQLLSGGEKSLTAIALVFAFFDLNPAPFCVLDEVDAPLDDANTQRFADLIAQMSRDVQFLCVTHNKVTMAAADRLVGVTMREPGVSSVVDVDLAAAVQFTHPATS